MGKEQQLPRHLKKILDLKRFDVVNIISLGDLHPVVVMRSKESDSKGHWCIHHRGSGYYFQTLKEVTDFLLVNNWIKTT